MSPHGAGFLVCTNLSSSFPAHIGSCAISRKPFITSSSSRPEENRIAESTKMTLKTETAACTKAFAVDAPVQYSSPSWSKWCHEQASANTLQSVWQGKLVARTWWWTTEGLGLFVGARTETFYCQHSMSWDSAHPKKSSASAGIGNACAFLCHWPNFSSQKSCAPPALWIDHHLPSNLIDKAATCTASKSKNWWWKWEVLDGRYLGNTGGGLQI